jgi:hypothetical protein
VTDLTDGEKIESQVLGISGLNVKIRAMLLRKSGFSG